MNFFLRPAFAGAVAILILGGCSKSAPGVTDRDTRAFDQASPELKQTWAAALEASKTNDYVTAETLLYGLLGQQPTAEQTDAIRKEIAALDARLRAAVAKGDPAAKAAFEQMQRNSPRRPH
jgi:hypothetical protein